MENVEEYRLSDIEKLDRILGLSENVEICQDKIMELKKSLQEWTEIKQGFETEIQNIIIEYNEKKIT